MAGIKNRNAKQRRQIKDTVFHAWGWRCAYCDCGLTSRDHLDHVIPRALDGCMARYSNFVASCQPCNLRKGSMSVKRFLKHDPVKLERIMFYVDLLAAAELRYVKHKARKRAAKARRIKPKHDNAERIAGVRVCPDYADLPRSGEP
jgi:hypothetical protein